MKEKMRGTLHRAFLMAFAFVFAVVFAGFVGKVDVKADTAICKVTVKVKDTSGNEIDNAVVHFVTKRSGSYKPGYIPGGAGEEVAETSKNDDGTYNVPYDAEWGDYYYYYATAEGYKTPTAYSTRVTIENPTATLTDIVLESYGYNQMVEDALGKAEKEIRNYVSVDDYESEQKDEVNAIITEQVDKIYAIDSSAETKEAADEKIAQIDAIVKEAKDKLDKVVTAQEMMNDNYAGLISFASTKGKTVKLAKDENSGKYGMTLSLNDKGGMFQVADVAADTVKWNAKMTLWYQSAGRNVEFEYIDNSIVKGKFLNQAESAGSSAAIPSDVTLATGTITNCSAKFTKDGKEITVLFDLNVTNEPIVDEDAEAAEAVEAMIADLGEITLDRQPAVTEAKAAYDALSDGAKAKVNPEKLAVLNAAIEKIEQLLKEAEVEDLKAELERVKTELAEALEAKAVAEANAANAEKAQKTAETKAANAEKAQKTAETKAANAVKAQKAAETKAANAVKAQKAAETKAANAVKAQKAAETKAANAVKAQKAAETKANEAIKSTLPKLTLNGKAGSKKATLTWNKTNKGTGYVIYRSTNKNSGYKKIKTITNWRTASFTDKNLKSKTTYYYKICVYKGNVEGTLSAVKSVRAK